LIYFARDYAQQKGKLIIDRSVAQESLRLLDIDENGLDEMDKRLLQVLDLHYGGGPVGIHTLAVAVGEEPDTLEEVHEPFLVQEGYLQRTSQGRVLTDKGRQYRKNLSNEGNLSNF
jgi:Holliday junction DNA helicase RuvB